MNSFTKEFTISSYDLNLTGRARLTTMANFFQEVAYHHANELGFGYDAMKKRKTTWVLSRMRMRMERYPVWNERIMVETWPSGAERLFALRDFKVLDASGKIIGMATTAWLILDMDSHRLIRPRDMMEQFALIVNDVRMFEGSLEKISLPGETRVLDRHDVVYSDLDIVGHVNNVRYMEWCIDAATSAEDAEKEIREFEINFNHEALLGDRIEIGGYADATGKTYVLGIREEDRKEIMSACFLRA